MKNIQSLWLLVLLLFYNAGITFGQNNMMVLNGAYVVLNGGTQANNIHLVVNQPSDQGIVRLPAGGHVHSENQYNFVTWNVGANTGSYIFPFGVGATPTDYVPFTFNKTVGNSPINMSTWSTNQQNSPKPQLSNVAPVTIMPGVTDSVLRAIDRFWDIRATGTTADLTFSYRGVENTTASPTSNVKAQHWNGTSWDAPVVSASVGVVAGIGTAGPYFGQNSFSPWVLVVDCPTAPTAGSNSPICEGTSINLTASSVTGGTYSWTGPNGFTSTDQNPIITNATLAMAGLYSVTVTVAGCTSPAGTTTVTVNPAPTTPVASSNSPVCEGSTINLTSNNIAGATYSWTGPNGFTSTFQNPSITNATSLMAGVYSVVATVGSCVSSAGTTTVTVNLTPTSPIASSNSPVCVGSQINLSSNLIPGATYAWSGPNGYLSAIQNPSIPSSTVAMSGTYSLTVTIGGCTSLPSTTNVVVNPIPSTPTVSSNSPVCEGNALNLTTNAVTGATYSWTGPGGFTSTSQNPSISSATSAMAGTYNLTVSIGVCNSPVGFTTVVVNPIPASPLAASNSPVCQGATINLTASSTAGATYSWTGPNGFTSTSQNPTITNADATMAGFYSVTITVGGCSSTPSTTNVVITPGINVTVTPSNPAIILGQTVQLVATGATNYTWTPSNGLSCSNCANPIASPTSTTTYIVTGTNIAGCSDSETVTIEVEIPCGELFIPTIFSPNNDGLNDEQCVMGGCIRTMNFSIYNRWGEIVFESNSRNICWDGTYKDKPVSVGVYVYKFSGVMEDGTIVQKSGNLNVVR